MLADEILFILAEGTVVGEYVGDYLTQKVADKRDVQYIKTDEVRARRASTGVPRS